MNIPDREGYKDRLRDVLLHAIMDAGVTEQPDGSKVVGIISVDVADVLTSLMAFFIADHPDFSSPTKCRAECDQFARRLQRRIAETQRIGTGIQRLVIEEVQ